MIAIRWTLNDIKKINSNSIYPAAVSFFPVFATGLAVMSVNGFTFKTTFMYLAEALLSAAAYFISRTVIIFEGTRSLGMLTPQETACLILTGCMILLSFAGFRIYDISLGRVAAILVILFAARYGGITGGAVAGSVACGAVMSLAGSDFFIYRSVFCIRRADSGNVFTTGKNR